MENFCEINGTQQSSGKADVFEDGVPSYFQGSQHIEQEHMGSNPFLMQAPKITPTCLS